MQSIKTAFTRAASGFAKSRPGLTVIWLMVTAIAILDESAQREEGCKPRHDEKRPKPPTP